MSKEKALKKLKTLLNHRLEMNPYVLKEHSKSEAFFPEYSPDAVVFAKDEEEIVKIVKICSQERFPIIPWGSGTSLEGHTLPKNGGLVLNLSQMNKILEINNQDMYAIVEPGVKRKFLNEELRSTGLFFSVDPGADASLGGMASTGASGTTTVRYGTIRDNILSLEVVTSDGEIIKIGNKAKKSSSGYDLKSIFIGSEGTLGIITKLTLKLNSIPEAISSAVCNFPSIQDAVNASTLIIQSGIPIARLELVDEKSISIINSYSNTELREKPHLFLEFHGSKKSVIEQTEEVKVIFSDFNMNEFKWSSKTEERNKLWKARHNAFYAYKSYYSDREAIVTDVCLPISKLTDIILDTQKDIERSGLPGPIIGHVGDGNFHAVLMVRKNNVEDHTKASKIISNMVIKSINYNGTSSGEHGIGLGKTKFMEREHGKSLKIMKIIKKSLDPKGIMNPGKIFLE